jgi:hypothetical protein
LPWSHYGPGLLFIVISAPVRDAYTRLADPGTGYAHIIACTPPGDLGIIQGAVLAVGTVIVPVVPIGLDLDWMRAGY